MNAHKSLFFSLVGGGQKQYGSIEYAPPKDRFFFFFFLIKLLCKSEMKSDRQESKVVLLVNCCCLIPLHPQNGRGLWNNSYIIWLRLSLKCFWQRGFLGWKWRYSLASVVLENRELVWHLSFAASVPFIFFHTLSFTRLIYCQLLKCLSHMQSANCRELAALA